jgi:cbb3-type cytochrome oxidase subunit 3
MLLNLLLLVLVFAADRKISKPWIPACLFGIVKGGIYLALTHNALYSICTAALFAVLVGAFAFLLRRLWKKEAAEAPEVHTYSTPGTESAKFRWEYIPLAILALLIIFGEVAANFIQIKI